MLSKIRKGISDRLDAQKTVEEIAKLCKHIEDISEAQDEMTKALVSIYAAVRKLADKQGVKLDDPLVNMTIENSKKDGKFDDGCKQILKAK